MKYLKLLRVKHWIKNLIILFPLVFNAELLKLDLLEQSVLGIVMFSILSSAIYIFNDIRDVESDKRHPLKSNRPIASGSISLKQAWCICGGLMILLLGGGTI